MRVVSDHDSHISAASISSKKKVDKCYGRQRALSVNIMCYALLGKPGPERKLGKPGLERKLGKPGLEKRSPSLLQTDRQAPSSYPPAPVPRKCQLCANW